MEDFNEDVVLNIDIKYDDAIEGIVKLQTANEKLQKDLTELKKAVDNNSASQDEYAKSAAATKVAIQRNNETIRAYQKEIKNNIKSEQQQGESLNALRAKLSALNQQYSNMDAVQREAAKESGGLQEQIIEITKTLKSEEEAMGQFYRNVGNYGQVAIGVKKNIKDMTKELEGLAAAGLQGTPEFNKLKIELAEFNKEIDVNSSSFSKLAGSLQGITGTFGAVQASMVAVGLDTEDTNKVMQRLTITLTVLAGLDSVAKMLNNSTFGMKAYSVATSMATGIMKIFGVTTTATSTAFKLLRGAIISTGIGALVVLIGALIANFDKLTGLFKKGEDGMSAFGKVWQKVKEIAMGVWEVIKGIFNFVVKIANPIGAIFTIATKGFKGLKDEAVKNLNVVANYEKGAQAQSVKNAENAAKAKAEADKRLLGQRLLDEATALEKQLEVDKAAGLSAAELHKREMEILEKKKQGYTEALKYITDQNSDSYKEMAKNLEDVNQQINVKNAAETKRQNDEAKTRNVNAAAAAKERNKNEIDALRQMQDTAIGIIKDGQYKEQQTVRNSYERQIEDLQSRLQTEKNLTEKARAAINTTIENLQQQQKDELAAIDKKYSEEELNRTIENENRRIELILAVAEKGSKDELNIKTSKLEQEKEAEIKAMEESIRLNEQYYTQIAEMEDKFIPGDGAYEQVLMQQAIDEQRLLIEQKYQKEKAQLQKEYDEKQLADKKAVLEKEAAQLQNKLNDELLALGENEQAKAQLKLENERALNEQLLAMDAETKAALGYTDESYEAAIIESRQRIADAEKAVQEAAQKTLQDRRSAMSDFASAMSDILNEIGGDNAAFAAFQKALALFNIALNTAQAISAAVATASSGGDPYTVAFRIAAAIAAAIAGTAAALKSAKGAKEPKAPKLAQGGTVTGAGSGTSDNIPAFLSNGESIMTAATTSMFAPVLSALNQIGGGVPIQAQQAAPN